MRLDDRRVQAVAAAIVGLFDALAMTETAPVYDADHLPPGINRGAYLRRHRARMRERVLGWSRIGHARLVTREAWDAELARETAGARAPTRAHLHAVPSGLVGDELDKALGIRTRAPR